MITPLWTDRALAVVRAERIPDPVALCRALADGGIRTVELTFTTPGVVGLLERAAGRSGVDLGVGTVRDADQARAALDAGAGFLVTPTVNAAVAAVAHDAGVPVYLGAFSPTEVAAALDLGATAVKIFPAGRLGPAYVADLLGPFPDAVLLPSGGVSTGNAKAFLDAGARAVCAGSGVVPPATVAAGRTDEITTRAREFTAALRAAPATT